MNNLIDPFERGGNAGRIPMNIAPQEQEVSPAKASISPEQVSAQLNNSEDRFKEVIEKTKKGDLGEIDYLLNTKKNLIAFKNLFHVRREFGAYLEANKKILERIEERQRELDEVLKSVAH